MLTRNQTPPGEATALRDLTDPEVVHAAIAEFDGLAAMPFCQLTASDGHEPM
jgi:hypothetical protein